VVKHGQKAGHLTDTYGLPGGRVEDDEKAEITVTRELLEETGLSAQEGSLVALPEKYTAEIERKDGTKKLFSLEVFLCKNYSGDLIASDETIPEWVPLEKLSEYNLLINVGKAIEQARQYL
jgi:8-oxo-dGTP pyrophosphatase MutT (NUDIX family)